MAPSISESSFAYNLNWQFNCKFKHKKMQVNTMDKSKHNFLWINNKMFLNIIGKGNKESIKMVFVLK